MKYLVLCYKKCSTCKKALKFLDDAHIEYELRDIKDDRPNRDELESWQKLAKVDIDRFFNTHGTIYKELGLKDKLKGLSYAEKLDLLKTDGMLVKRPLLIGNDKVLVGFDPKEWENL